MNKVLSIVSLLSALWCYGLLYIIDALGLLDDIFGGLIIGSVVYIIVLLYNIFTIWYCFKIQKENHTSKIPFILAIVGTILHVIGIAVFIFAVLMIYNPAQI